MGAQDRDEHDDRRGEGGPIRYRGTTAAGRQPTRPCPTRNDDLHRLDQANRGGTCPVTARPDDGRLRRWRAWLVWAVFGLDLALVIGVGLAAGPWPDTPAFVPALFAAMVASLGGVGALVATRKPRDPVGWILLASASMVTLAVTGEDYVRLSVTVFGGALPLTVATAWLESLAFGPAIILLAGVMPLYFPDGRLPSRRWRWVVWIAAFGIIVGILQPAFATGSLGNTTIDNPLGIPGIPRPRWAPRSRECPAGGRGPAAGDRLDHPQVPARILHDPGAVEVVRCGGIDDGRWLHCGRRRDRTDQRRGRFLRDPGPRPPPDRHRHRHPSLPALRHRPDHQPDGLVRRGDRDPGGRVRRNDPWLADRSRVVLQRQLGRGRGVHTRRRRDLSTAAAAGPVGRRSALQPLAL